MNEISRKKFIQKAIKNEGKLRLMNWETYSIVNMVLNYLKVDILPRSQSKFVDFGAIKQRLL